MPNVFLIASKKDAELLQKNIEAVGPALRQATAYALPDLGGDPNKVCVYIFAHNGGDNIPSVQILAMASWSEEREEYLPSWKKALAIAWKDLLGKTPGLAQYQGIFPLNQVEIWPIMPKGSWGIAAEIVRSYMDL